MSKNSPKFATKIRVPADAKILIVASRYNESHVNFLLERCVEKFRKIKIAKENIEIVRVPGASEIPATIELFLSGRERFSVAIALGMIIAGETPHHEIIAHSTANALQNVAIARHVPVINGIIVANNDEQARERVFGKTDRGNEFANAALEMLSIFAAAKKKYWGF